jgi:hypothetical protein
VAAKSGSRSQSSFLEEFAKLLRSRKVRVPRGLKDAPAEAYASQPASMVESLADLPKAELERYAEKIATFAKRQAERAQQAWDGSPLLAELRRRGLEEPAPPKRVVGPSPRLNKPLEEWTDRQILEAAKRWSRMGS